MPNHLHGHAKKILRKSPHATRNEIVFALGDCVQCEADMKNAPLKRSVVNTLRAQVKAEGKDVSGLSTESMTMTEYMESPAFERFAAGN